MAGGSPSGADVQRPESGSDGTAAAESRGGWGTRMILLSIIAIAALVVASVMVQQKSLLRSSTASPRVFVQPGAASRIQLNEPSTPTRTTRAVSPPSTSNPANLKMKRCVYTKWGHKQGRSKQRFPAPICESWAKEGTDGDLFFPANRATAKAKFAELNAILHAHIGAPECLPKLKEATLRNFRQVDKGGDTLYPAMWGDELEVVIKTLANLAPRSYMEWGAGGSSRWLTSTVKEKVFSVDNYPPWCERVVRDPFVKCLVDRGIFKFKCEAPKGSQGTWGKTQNNAEGQRSAVAYVDSIDSFGLERFDFVFVDGRFRLACALKALNYVDDLSVVVIHDFWGRFHKYGKALEYYDVIGRSRSAVIMQKKRPSELPSDWRTIYKKYANVENQG